MTKIRCKIEKRSFLIQVSGHAGYAEVNRDIVCSAISCLLCTLASSLETIEDIDKEIRLDDGDASISVEVPYWRSMHIRIMFETIARGFEMLAEQYPDNVEFVNKI